MKKIIFRFFIAILSLTFGITSVWLTSSVATITVSQENGVLSSENQASIKSTLKEDFVMVSRGCGRYGSYAQTYYLETEATSEGVSCSKNAKRANKDFHELLVK